jgi:hypothetical protein
MGLAGADQPEQKTPEEQAMGVSMPAAGLRAGPPASAAQPAASRLRGGIGVSPWARAPSGSRARRNGPGGMPLSDGPPLRVARATDPDLQDSGICQCQPDRDGDGHSGRIAGGSSPGPTTRPDCAPTVVSHAAHRTMVTSLAGAALHRQRLPTRGIPASEQAHRFTVVWGASLDQK